MRPAPFIEGIVKRAQESSLSAEKTEFLVKLALSYADKQLLKRVSTTAGGGALGALGGGGLGLAYNYLKADEEKEQDKVRDAIVGSIIGATAGGVGGHFLGGGKFPTKGFSTRMFDTMDKWRVPEGAAILHGLAALGLAAL